MEKAMDKEKVVWVRYDFLLLIADRWWRTADPVSRGLYWSIVTDLYAEGGRLLWDAGEIARACNCDDVAAVERVLGQKFYVEMDEETGQRWVRHKKVDAELGYARRFYEKQAGNGRKGGRPRKDAENEYFDSETSGFNSENPLVISDKPMGFLKITTDRPTEPTENTNKQTDRPTDTEAGTQQLPEGHGVVRLFRFVDAVQKELRARSAADATTVKNVGQFLMGEEERTGEKNLLHGAFNIAVTCRSAHKPIAVWCNRMKDVYGWVPQGAR